MCSSGPAYPAATLTYRPHVGTPRRWQYSKGAQNCIALNRHAANVLPYGWDTVWRQPRPLSRNALNALRSRPMNNVLAHP